MSEKCIGVIGGLGPAATVSFMTTVLECTPLDRSRGHLHLIVDSNPRVADINAAVLGLGASPSAELQTMARRLETAGADFLVMACNAAHFYEDDIRNAVAIPFLSMVDATCGYIANRMREVRRVGIVATDGGIRCGIYQRGLAAHGLEWLAPSDTQTEIVMAAVESVRSGVRGAAVRDPLVTQIDSFLELGADCVIAACTEIPLVLTDGDTRVPVIDPAAILARAAIDFAMDDR